MTTHDRKDVIAAAEEAGIYRLYDGISYGPSGLSSEQFERFYALAHEDGRKAEREDCAKVCDSREDMHRQNYGGYIGQHSKIAEAKCCADDIRARSKE